MSAYSLGQLRSDLRMTLLMAGAYSFLALIGFGLLAASVLLGKRVDGGQAATVGSVLGALGVFVLVYITAAVGWAPRSSSSCSGRCVDGGSGGLSAAA